MDLLSFSEKEFICQDCNKCYCCTKNYKRKKADIAKNWEFSAISYVVLKFLSVTVLWNLIPISKCWWCSLYRKVWQ